MSGEGRSGILVTVLIPTYNRPAFLPEAIASAIAQSHGNLEVVVLDDASPDGGRTEAAVQPFLADPRVRYVRHPFNVGIARNWRIGLGLVAGAFFCLLHDDDTFEPTFVADLLSALIGAADNAVIAFCDQWATDPAGRRLPASSDRMSRRFGRDRLAGGPVVDFPRTALVDLAIPIGATLFRRTDIGPELIADEAMGSIDMWLLYGCVQTGKQAIYVPARLMNYRLHPGGMSASRPLYMAEGHLWRYRRMLADPSLASIAADVRMAADRTRTDYGVHLIAAGRWAAARAALASGAGRKAFVGRWLARAGPLGTAAVRLGQRAKAWLNSGQDEPA